MQIFEVIWRAQFVDKIESKHGIGTDEVEQVLFGNPHIRKAEKGRIKGEDLYSAYGRTQRGRYLLIFFVGKDKVAALPISARDMTSSERKYYEQQKKSR